MQQLCVQSRPVRVSSFTAPRSAALHAVAVIFEFMQLLVIRWRRLDQWVSRGKIHAGRAAMAEPWGAGCAMPGAGTGLLRCMRLQLSVKRGGPRSPKAASSDSRLAKL